MPWQQADGASGHVKHTLAGAQKLRTMSFSLAGSQEWPKGMDTTPNIISNGEPVPCAMHF